MDDQRNRKRGYIRLLERPVFTGENSHHQRHDGYWPRTDSAAYAVLWTVGSGLITAGIFTVVYELVFSHGAGKLTRVAAYLVTLVLPYGGAILSPSHAIGHYSERTLRGSEVTYQSAFSPVFVRSTVPDTEDQVSTTARFVSHISR